MILIADSGSTKTEWVVLDAQGDAIDTFITKGFSPNSVSTLFIVNELKNSAPFMKAISFVQKIFFYGTGCSSPETNAIISDALKFFINETEIYIQNDLYASVHATAGSEAAIVCILGTGSNSCYFDGTTVHGDDFSLGYILGDEGSGSFMGKIILRDYFYNNMPDDLHKTFQLKYNLFRNDVIESIYRKERASEFLASFNPFIKEHISHAYCRQIVENSFQLFIKHFVLRFDNVASMPVHFTGSVAYNFKEILTDIVQKNNLQCRKIIASPMGELVKYIKKNLM
ncbi:MAG: N-acetylglucosamine kinase [Fimbriimonadaceae bacterium]|nr:N-acetylglucosamine kinase [Chitinophagales bacterium]